MKILVMASGNSIHMERWVDGLALQSDFELRLLTMDPAGTRETILNSPKIKHVFEVFSPTKIKERGDNWQYLINLPKILKIVKNLKSNIINTIYLASYGFIGALIKSKSFLCHFINGSDMMVAPFKKIMYKWITKFAVRKADFLVVSS